MSDQKRLFLVDAYALIFRGYYAFIKNPRINSKGEDTSAIMGFMNSLLDVIKRERPDHLAVCFDKGGSVDRVEMNDLSNKHPQRVKRMAAAWDKWGEANQVTPLPRDLGVGYLKAD